MKRLMFVALLAACTTAPVAPPPASTPPPPDRPENAAVVFGVVRDASGAPVRRARIRAWAADRSCQMRGNPTTHVTGVDGAFDVRVEEAVGPEYDGCVVVEAAAGGAVARVQQLVHFASDRAGNNRVRADIQLLPATPLTRAEADRLIELVRRALRREQAAFEELALYLGEDVSATYTRLTAPMQTLRNVEQVNLVGARGSEYLFELVGQRSGTSQRVRIRQDSLTRIEFL